MKVCQLCAVDFTVEKFLLPLIDGMEAVGWDVTVICSDGPAIPSLIAKGYKFKTISISRSINPLRALLTVLLLYRVFKKEKYDIIHVHTPVAALIGRIAAALVGKSYVIYTAHGFYFHDEMPSLKRIFFVSLERFAGRFTDFLFCQSAEDARDAIQKKIMPAERILTIGNGVDENLFNSLKYPASEKKYRKNLNIPEDAFVVGIIARMVKEKGYCELFEASTELANRYPNFYLLIIGGKLPSDHDATIEKELASIKNKMGPRLIELGFRTDTPLLLSVIDIFCLPSYREGMPRTIIEAMMMGKPVVATNIRGCRELVISGETGILVKYKNSFELMQAINYLIINPEVRKEMGLKARVNAHIFYKEKNIIKKQIDKIQELLCQDA